MDGEEDKEDKEPVVKIQHFFDEQTGTLSYVVYQARTGVVIDPVRNYDPKSARTSWKSSEQIASFIDAEGIDIPYVIDTHAHADHMTALPFFKERYGARTVTGARIGEIQSTFRDVYNLDPDFAVDGSVPRSGPPPSGMGVCAVCRRTPPIPRRGSPIR